MTMPGLILAWDRGSWSCATWGRLECDPLKRQRLNATPSVSGSSSDTCLAMSLVMILQFSDTYYAMSLIVILQEPHLR